MRCSIYHVATLAALGIAANAVAAQSADQQSAYVALSYTPVGGLPPLPPVGSLGGKAATEMSLVGRLGHISRDGGLSLTSYGV